MLKSVHNQNSICAIFILWKQGTFTKFSSVPCFHKMKIVHNTVLKMNGLYCPNIYTLCLFSQHEFLQNSNWQNGSPLNFLCRRRNLTSFFLWIDFRFRRLHRFWHRLCCQMCSAHWSQPWCQSWTALGWDGCQGILEHRIWEKGKRDFCLNLFFCVIIRLVIM